MNIVDLSKNTMEEVRNIVSNSDKYSLIDFYAFWCEPCIMLNPVLEKIADNYNEDITVYRVDVDKNPAIADEYNITNVPTLVLQKLMIHLKFKKYYVILKTVLIKKQ